MDIYVKDFISYYIDNIFFMFITVLFTVARKGKQPICSSTDGLIIKNMMHIHNIILLAVKKTEIMRFAGKQIELRSIMMSNAT